MSMNSANLPAATRRGTKEVATLSPEPRRAARPSSDVRSRLLDEYLDLKERVKPLEKRLEEVRDRLLDLVTEHGHFIDEVLLVSVRVEPRFGKEYNSERLAAAFPRLAGCLKLAVDVAQLEACLRAGMVTESELEREGVVARTLRSRALIVKPLARRTGPSDLGFGQQMAAAAPLHSVNEYGSSGAI